MMFEERMRAVWFHFRKMRESQLNGNFEEFRYYFDAIIPLARSVTSLIQKELKDKEGFQDWYGDPKESDEGTIAYDMKKDELFAFFNNERNLILKEGKPKSEWKGRYKFDAFFDGDLDFKPRIKTERDGEKISGKLVNPLNPSEEIDGKVRVSYFYYLNKKPEVQAIIHVHRYLRKLERIAIEASKKFVKKTQ